jgi:hypothetical protein
MLGLSAVVSFSSLPTSFPKRAYAGAYSLDSPRRREAFRRHPSGL